MMANEVSNTVKFKGTEAAMQLALAICVQCNGDFEGASYLSTTGDIEITYITRYSPEWEYVQRVSTVLSSRTIRFDYCEPMLQIFGSATFENGRLLEYSESIGHRATEWSAHSGLLREYALDTVGIEGSSEVDERRLVSESPCTESQLYGNASTADSYRCPFAEAGPCPFGLSLPSVHSESEPAEAAPASQVEGGE